MTLGWPPEARENKLKSENLVVECLRSATARHSKRLTTKPRMHITPRDRRSFFGDVARQGNFSALNTYSGFRSSRRDPVLRLLCIPLQFARTDLAPKRSSLAARIASTPARSCPAGAVVFSSRSNRFMIALMLIIGSCRPFYPQALSRRSARSTLDHLEHHRDRRSWRRSRAQTSPLPCY